MLFTFSFIHRGVRRRGAKIRKEMKLCCQFLPGKMYLEFVNYYSCVLGVNNIFYTFFL